MSHYYPINGKQLASVTTIIDDCTDKSNGLMPWAARMACEYIKINSNFSIPDNIYHVPIEIFDAAVLHFREVSQEALDIGSAVHSAIEYYLKTGKEPEWLK